ncbi:MAG: ArsR/SmtB family transcription factor [Candidatus Thorarchaeota archaeon]
MSLFPKRQFEVDELQNIGLSSKKEIASILKAISHEHRIEMLVILYKGPIEFSELQKELGISKTALSNHITQLLDNRLIKRLGRGSYQISIDGLNFLTSIVSNYRDSQVFLIEERSKFTEIYSNRSPVTGEKIIALKKLKWQNRWVSHLGAIESCLKYLQMKIPTQWLYGATGHAFILNIGENMCPSGPTAWNTEMLFNMAPKIGYKVNGIIGMKSEPDFIRMQKNAWTLVKDAIDNNLPCYGWELMIPEYYLIKGYDTKGYYFTGPLADKMKGPKDWTELGNTDISILELYSVTLGNPLDDQIVIKEALRNSLIHSTNPPKWIRSEYRSGLEGYDRWIRCTKNGTAQTQGMAYNTAVWSECRTFAVDFLKLSKKKLKGIAREEFEEAIMLYNEVSDNLKKVMKLYPYNASLNSEEIGIDKRNVDAVDYLVKAKNAESLGMKILRRLVVEL